MMSISIKLIFNARIGRPRLFTWGHQRNRNARNVRDRKTVQRDLIEQHGASAVHAAVEQLNQSIDQGDRTGRDFLGASGSRHARMPAVRKQTDPAKAQGCPQLAATGCPRLATGYWIWRDDTSSWRVS